MARTAKAAGNLQIFRGSLARPDVFAENAGKGCCGDNALVTSDKLGQRVRADNANAHTNPYGFRETFSVPAGNGFAGVSRAIIDHINTVGVGATISVIAIPTYAFLTGVGINVIAEEVGLTFNLVTRNGLVLPTDLVTEVTLTPGDSSCEITRTPAAGDETSYEGFGALGTNLGYEVFGSSAIGEFSLEADELILEVVSMPAGGVIAGTFDIRVTAAYTLIHRAEQ